MSSTSLRPFGCVLALSGWFYAPTISATERCYIMTASKFFIALLTHTRRTLARVLHRVSVSSATLTLSIPPFVKLEIKTEPAKPKSK